MGQPKKRNRSSTSSSSSKSKREKKSGNDDGKEKDQIVDESTDESKAKNIDDHPLDIKSCLVVRYRDGSQRLATIIERISKQGDDGIEWQYYVHYHDFNRRMDEWLDSSRILKFPSEANALSNESISEVKLEETLTESNLQINSLTSSDKISVDSNSLSLPPAIPRNVSTSSLASLGLSGKTSTTSAIKRRRSSNESVSSMGDVDIGMTAGPTTINELEHDEHEGLDEASLKEHEEITKIKNIRSVLFGKHCMECWYFSPFPKEYFPDGPIDCLYFCEFTFRFFRSKEELVRYQSKPSLPRHPPGNEIYRDSSVSMFEVDGFAEKIYCQNLCYFAKLFLDHKTLYFDVDPFLFYVLCSQDDRGYHPVGYFSKEKFSDLGYNLACILVFPSAQRQGYGRFLIALSYELSKKEEKIGSPEKPLSDLGAVSYKSYWASTLLKVLRSFPGSSISILELAKMTSIFTEDVIATLQQLLLLRNINGSYLIYAPPDIIEELMAKYPTTGLLVDPEKLHWAPLYVTDIRKDKWSIKAKRDVNSFDET